MDIKKISLSVIVVFVYIFFEQYIFHGVILKTPYEQTSILWRGEENFLMQYMLISQILFSIFLTIIFIQNHENNGIKEGLRFGLLFGLLLGALDIGRYSYMPIPFSLSLAWVVDSLILCIGSGIILSLICGSSKDK